MPTPSVYPQSVRAVSPALSPPVPLAPPPGPPSDPPPGHPISPPGEPFQGPPKAPLGIYAKSRPETLQDVGLFDPDTGEVLSPETKQAIDPVSVRLGRYVLQSQARRILGRDHRLFHCLHTRQRDRPSVDVLHAASSDSCYYSGLQTCASVWACPVCAARISERRREELRQAVNLWKAQGGSVLLLTLTNAHTRADALTSLLEGQQAALHRFFATRAGITAMSSLGRVGHVRAWEVTTGRLRANSNGWHPHFHILLFLRSPPSDPLPVCEDQLFGVWLRACELAGLPLPNRAHGVSLQDGSQASAYIAKLGLEEDRVSASSWSIEHEMTKGHTKRARNGETPFDLIRACLAGDDPQAARLFREFASAFKGKRQLVYSRGLRDLLGLDALLTDDELAARPDDDAYLLASITPEQWRAVKRADLRGELLEVARSGGPDAVAVFLLSLMSKPQC